MIRQPEKAPNILKAYFLTIFISTTICADERYGNPEILMQGGSLPLPCPTYIDINQNGDSLNITSSTGMRINFSDKDSGFIRLPLHSECDLNKALLYIPSINLEKGFAGFSVAAKLQNLICGCHDPSCSKGAAIYAPDLTYTASFCIQNNQYICSFIIENGYISFTIVDYSNAGNFIKVRFSKISESR